MQTLRTTAAELAEETLLNPDFFAQEVTLRMRDENAEDEDVVVNAHVRYTKRYPRQPDGTTQVIEQARLTVAKADLPRAFAIGDRLYIVAAEAAYLYTGNDKDTLACYKPVFERQRMTAQGTRPRA